MTSPAQYKRARVIKLELQLLLGAFCKHCGTEDELEFDCIDPQGGYHHRMNSCDRVYFYRRQHAERNLQILCALCHRAKTINDNKKLQSQPF